MNDDDPLDLAQVSADDVSVENLLSPAYDHDDDAALRLLRHLVKDVSADLPEPYPVSASRGSTVVTVAGARGSDTRLARNGALVGVLTAGVVSLSGVAAASTLVPAGYPLHGLGEAVRSAAGAVVDAVSLPERAGGRSAGSAADRTVTLPSAATSPAPSAQRSTAPAVLPTPGAVVSAAARSQAAARQVAALLDAAEQLLADGRTEAASARLVAAERRLAEVLPADVQDLAARLDRLKKDVEAAAAAADGPPTEPPAQRQEPAAKQDRPNRQAEPRTAPSGKQARPRGESSRTPPGESLRDWPARQLSSVASTKPRA